MVFLSFLECFEIGNELKKLVLTRNITVWAKLTPGHMGSSKKTPVNMQNSQHNQQKTPFLDSG